MRNAPLLGQNKEWCTVEVDAVTDDDEPTDDASGERVPVLPIEDSIDLHGFQPRDVVSVVEDYLPAAAERGFSEVRLIHGRGKGVQRAQIRRLLERHPLVAGFHDAPASRGGWGATVVRLGRREASMTNPFAPPGDANPSSGGIAAGNSDGVRQRWRSFLDTLLLVMLGLGLAPHVLLNAALWLGHLQGIGLYDPEVGGDPAWRGRSLTGPLLVAVIATARLFVARGRHSMRPGLKRAYVALAIVAVLAALVVLIPEPSFSWGKG